MLTGLIQYNRTNMNLPLADKGEKIGNAGLGLLRLAIGKTVAVTHDTTKPTELIFQETNRPLKVRIAAIALAILVFPVTLILTGIGCVGLAFSKSHTTIHSKFHEQTNKRQDENSSKEDVKEEVKDEVEEKKSDAPTGFTRKFLRAPNLDFSNVHGKPMLLAALNNLQMNPLMKTILDTWLIFEKQQLGQKDVSLLDAMALKIKGGTCYGQAMNILELVGAKNQDEISEKYLFDKMSWQYYVTYQILHILHVFVLNQNSARVSGMNVKDAKIELESRFPHQNNRGKSSEKLNIASLDQDLLVGHLSDFVKQHIRDRNSTDDKQNYAVQITLNGKEDGHAAIIYYNVTQKLYFWYDPYMPDSGLFSTNNSKEFFKGVAAKLLEYKTVNKFTHLYFTAYKVE